MNTKFKLVRVVVAAMFGSLLWAGCASDQVYYSDASLESRPVDLTRNRADTHPELRNGAEENAGWKDVSELPANGVIMTESAGAPRVTRPR